VAIVALGPDQLFRSDFNQSPECLSIAILTSWLPTHLPAKLDDVYFAAGEINVGFSQFGVVTPNLATTCCQISPLPLVPHPHRPQADR
jgi:hypothetical protein